MEICESKLRFLGGFISDQGDKVLHWSVHVRTLAAVAILQPQAAYVALTKSLQSDWLELFLIVGRCLVIWRTLCNLVFCLLCLVLK